MLWTTNQPAELNSPPLIFSIFLSSTPFSRTSPQLLLLIFAFVCPFSPLVAQNNPQMLSEPEIASNLSEFYTKEPNWSIGDFDERKQPKKRKDNQLTSRYGLRIDHCPEGGGPELDSLNGQVKLCQLDDECRPSYKCQNIIGLTHFGKQMRYCCPTKTTACTEKPRLEPIIPGRCRPLKIFYYFDVEQLTCVKARMAQCEDFGRNRFASILECRTKCETTACELGESILLRNASFDKPFLCDTDEDCPVGYNCRSDKIFQRNVCCGFLDFEPCPLGFRSFTVPFSGRPKTCISSDTRDECPTDYVCTQNQINQEHYCCTVENGVCPEGHQAYIHPLTDGTIKCNLKGYESTTACPPGYACLAAVFGSSWGFCCSQAVVASCPDDSYPQINSLTNQPQRCEMMQPHACAKGFVCESDSLSHLGFCCSVPRKFTRKKTHPPELIPRKKTRPTPTTTTIEPEEEEEEEQAKIIQVTEGTTVTLATTTTQNIQPTFVVTTTIRGKRKGDWREKGKRKKKKKEGRRDVEERNLEETDENKTSEEEGPNLTSFSDEKSFEKRELTKLSTKLDRFITGIRKRTALPKGHRRPKPRIWKLKKGRGRGQEMIDPPARRREDENETDEKDEREEKRSEENEKEENMMGKRHPRPRCPSNYRPMAYPGTKWTYLECLPEKAKKKRRKGDEVDDEEDADENDEEDESGGDNDDLMEEEGNERRRQHSSICPKPAICLLAKNDPFRRALCCLRRKEENGYSREDEKYSEGNEEEEEMEEEKEMEGKRRRKKKKKGRKEDDEEEEHGEEEEDEEVNEKEEEEEREKMSEELVKIKNEEEAVEASIGAKKRRTKSPPIVQIDTTQIATTSTTSTTTMVSTTTTIYRGNVLMVEKSNDPTCPRLIADRICAPGSTRDCKERGFFCQFNREKRQFVCCSKK